MKKNIIILLLFLLPSSFLMAQSESYGSWTTVSLEKKLNKKWDVEAEAELRTVGGNDLYFVRLVERMSLGLSADYNIIKSWKVGAGYQLMNKLDTKYSNYQWRNRMNVYTTGRLKFNDLTFSLRERIQLTTKDESNRIRENGDIDTYKVNPEWSWRNRIKMTYNIPRCKITPSFSVESFYELNNPAGNSFDKFRYTLAFDYKVKKKHLFQIFGVLNSTNNADDEDLAFGKYVLGAGYTYSFK